MYEKEVGEYWEVLRRVKEDPTERWDQVFWVDALSWALRTIQALEDELATKQAYVDALVTLMREAMGPARPHARSPTHHDGPMGLP